MCGIIGYVGVDARARTARVEHARDAMIHRGPVLSVVCSVVYECL